MVDRSAESPEALTSVALLIVVLALLFSTFRAADRLGDGASDANRVTAHVLYLSSDRLEVVARR